MLFLKTEKKAQQELHEEFRKFQLSNLKKRKHHMSKLAEAQESFNLQNERVRRKISLTITRSK